MEHEKTFVEAIKDELIIKAKCISIWTDIVGREPVWEDVTDDNVALYREKLSSSSNNPNSNLQKFKTFLVAHSFEIPSEDFSDILKTTGQHICNTFALTDAQLEKLINYRPYSHEEGFVRKIFLIQAFTGLNYKIALKLKTENLSSDMQWISYNDKNGEKHSVPFFNDCVPVELARNYHVNKTMELRSTMYIKYLRQVFRNAKIREGAINFGTPGRACEIVIPDNALTTYATRRYFKGHSTNDIMKCMGLKSLEGLRGRIQGYVVRKKAKNGEGKQHPTFKFTMAILIQSYKSYIDRYGFVNTVTIKDKKETFNSYDDPLKFWCDFKDFDSIIEVQYDSCPKLLYESISSTDINNHKFYCLYHKDVTKTNEMYIALYSPSKQ